MSSLIESGQNWMKPLLNFRNELQQDRNKSENRESTRRNGQLINEEGMNPSNYTPGTGTKCKSY